VLEGVDAIVWRADPEARVFTFVSGGAQRLIGYPPAVWLGEPEFASRLIHHEDREQTLAMLNRAAEGAVAFGQFRIVATDGRLVWLHISARREGGDLYGVMIEVTESKRAERRLFAQYEITRALAEAPGLTEVAPTIIRVVCECLGWTLGGLWWIDPHTERVRLTTSWQSPAADLLSFITTSRTLELNVGEGIPGRVLAAGRPIWVEDILQDPNLPRAEAAARAGLRAACAFPVVVNDEATGLFEFFDQEPRGADADMLAMLATTGLQVGEFVEHRAAERARRESEGRAAAVIASALDCVISIDHNGAVVEFNPSAEQMFGISRDAAIGVEMCELIVPARFRDAHRVGIARYLATGSGPILGKRIELAALRSDGSEFPCELTVVPVDTTGPPMFTGYVRDLTERIEGEEALRRTEESYRMMFEAHPTAMWVYDLNTLEILAVNDAAIRQYGYSRAEFLEMTIAGLRPETEIPGLVAAVSRVTEGPTSSGPWRHRRRDGTIVNVEIASHTTTFAGKRAEVVLATDITEREQLTAQLHQAQKMEMVGQLAGGIAHDYNNISLVIRGYAEQLVDQLDDGQQRTSATEIVHAAERASSLTRQLLAFSRRQVLNPKDVDLSDIVHDLRPMLGRLLPDHVELSTTAASGCWVNADADQVSQVMMNLVINARDAMPGGGRLTIETSTIAIDSNATHHRLELQPGHYAVLTVSDTGHGMDAATRERIFEPFFTTKEPHLGTGLGLATVYGIVKQSRGSIWVYSEPGHGTTFKIYLPLVVADRASQAPAASSSAPPQGTGTILFVDDHEQIRTLVHLTLEQLGYSALVASNGGEALGICEAHDGPIDLLITDVMMPGMNGRELARRVRERRPLAVLFTSGYAADVLGDEGLGAGEHYLQKPYGKADLAEAIRVALARTT
jgi:two-component system, cell cycle sensor histidine kinase and response regulator CckA